MSYIDVILLAIIGIVVFISVKSGFFKTLFDLVGYIVAVVVAKSVSLILAKNAFDTFIRGGAEEYLNSVVSEITTEQLPEQTDRVVSSIPDGLRGLLNVVGFTEEKIADQISTIETSGQNMVTDLMDNVIEPIGVGIMQFLIFIILGIVLLVAAKIIVSLLNKIVKKLPVIKRFNSLLGGIIGFIKGVVLASVFAGALGVIASTSDNQGLIDAVSNSAILNFFTGIIGNFSF
ncbi:MAG: CvpA family protein [Clostridia bacterium]|nr:CvpA family protein [Clostridia bacterium]